MQDAQLVMFTAGAYSAGDEGIGDFCPRCGEKMRWMKPVGSTRHPSYECPQCEYRQGCSS